MYLLMNSVTRQYLVTNLTRFLSYETRSQPWKFDWLSALIGAIVTLFLTVFIFAQREKIKELLKQIWSPVTNWREQAHASQEEQYLTALMKALRDNLSFMTADAPADFQPPQFLIPTPLPLNVADAAKPTKAVQIPFDALLDGHNRLIIIGSLGSGRTRVLCTLAQQINRELSDSGKLNRLPIWIDLKHFTVPDTTPQNVDKDYLGSLAQKTVPGINPKWITQKISRRPVIVLIDNWESLNAEQRVTVAAWIGTEVESANDAFWIVAGDLSGFGSLTEIDFVPIALRPNTDSEAIQNLHSQWGKELGIQQELPDEVSEAFDWVARSGATPEELISRIVLYLRSEELPETPQAVAEALLHAYLPIDTTSPDLDATWTLAQSAAIEILTRLAGEARLHSVVLTRQEIAATIVSQLPPKDERPPKLESAIRKMLQSCRILRRDGRSKQWTIEPGYWEDYLTARYLAKHDFGIQYIDAHLNDQQWQRIIEFYASIIDISALLHPLLDYANETGSLVTLRRLVRLALVSPPDFTLRNSIIKSIAAMFMDPGLPIDDRLDLGRDLAQVAGNGARAFFVQMLRSPALQVRCAALRGLGWCGTPKDLNILASALQNKNIDVQASAINAMHDLGTPGASTYLAKALAHISEVIMPLITTALADMPGGDELLEQVAASDDLLLRRAAAEGLAKLAGKHQQWAYDLLVRLAREDPEWLVRSASETLVMEVDKEHKQETRVNAPPEAEAIDWLIAWAARQNLGLGVGDAAFEMLVRAAQEGNSDVKILAAKTLAQIGHKKHLDILAPLLQDADPLVRQIARNCLEALEIRYRYPIPVSPVIVEEENVSVATFEDGYESDNQTEAMTDVVDSDSDVPLNSDEIEEPANY